MTLTALRGCTHGYLPLFFQSFDTGPGLHPSANALYDAEEDRHNEHQYCNPECEPLRLPPVILPELSNGSGLCFVERTL